MKDCKQKTKNWHFRKITLEPYENIIGGDLEDCYNEVKNKYSSKKIEWGDRFENC